MKNTGTLKRIERLHFEGGLPTPFPLRPVAHHFGAVPLFQVDDLMMGQKHFYIALLPPLGRVKVSCPIEQNREMLLSLERYLPQLFNAYFEQIGFYLRAIFYGASEECIIKYAHRIRSIVGESIRSKLELLRKRYTDSENQELAVTISAAYAERIRMASAVDAFGHLVANYVYSFFCLDSQLRKYEERLRAIFPTEGIETAQHPVAVLRASLEHIDNPTPNDIFVDSINNVEDKWLIPFMEASAFIGEIKRSKVGYHFYSPTIFAGYHFNIPQNDLAFTRLEAAIKSHWPHVHLLRGRQLNRNIRWSLLGRIWICDTYIFFIPPSFLMKDGTLKPFNPRSDWLLLELVYIYMLGKHSWAMAPSTLDDKVLETFRDYLRSYDPDHEIPQIGKRAWKNALVSAKELWLQVLKDQKYLLNVDATDAQTLEVFETAVLVPVHHRLVRLFFKAAYWYLPTEALSLLQLIVKKLPTGHGDLSLNVLRTKFSQAVPGGHCDKALQLLLEFRFNFGGTTYPLVVAEDNKVSLLLGRLIGDLCLKYCCSQNGIIDQVRTDLLSPRAI